MWTCCGPSSMNIRASTDMHVCVYSMYFLINYCFAKFWNRYSSLFDISSFAIIRREFVWANDKTELIMTRCVSLSGRFVRFGAPLLPAPVLARRPQRWRVMQIRVCRSIMAKRFVWFEVQRLLDSFDVNTCFVLCPNYPPLRQCLHPPLRQSHNLGHIMIAYI